jgi:two-component system CheB/CheR fusion protein
MYFNADTQSRILARFHFALADQGYLFLGKAEMLLTHVNLFSPVDLKCRIFKKVMKVTLRERLQLLNQIGDEDNGTRLTRFLRLRDLSTESIPIAQLIVDGDGELAYANERARLMFALTARDIGKPFRDLEVSYRPIELRSLIEQAFTERRMVTKAGIERNVHDQAQHLDVEITPLLENGATVLGCSITFQDVTRVSQLQAEVQRSKQELETAYEELQSTNEELETTNEELQSTVEELETTNEELQSTNEELETMNEELQSTNEELQSVNTELRERTDELNRATHFQESILASLEVGVVVVDAQLHVLIWNRQMTDLWGLREEEVKGKSLIEIEMGLPVERMLDRLQHCVRGEAGGAPVTVSAVNRRGKTITCRILCSPLSQTGSPPTGAIVLVEDFSQAEASGPKASNH